MNRRDFILAAGLGSVSVTIGPELLTAREIKTAGDLNKFLRSIHNVREPSVDRIIIGDPGTVIRRVGTAWMPYFSTLRKAVDLGINVLVVHEPTFYSHWDLDTGKIGGGRPLEEDLYFDAIKKKKDWIEKNELVIIRCHDVLDIVKDFGIPYALGLALGYKNEDIVRSKDYFNVYRVERDSALNIAKKIAAGLKRLNQPGVAFYGDPERIISSVGLGTGTMCDPRDYAELKPDLYIAIDDTIRTWIQTTYAEDTGNPLIVINHGTSEENGMRVLNTYLKEKIPAVEFFHLDQGCGYRWINAGHPFGEPHVL
jgi:putative NIF3 family GTP cyclohydrolase 1 type 2